MQRSPPGSSSKRKPKALTSPVKLDRFFQRPVEPTELKPVFLIDEDDKEAQDATVAEFVEVARPTKRRKTSEEVVIVDDDVETGTIPEPRTEDIFPVTENSNSVFNVLKPKKGTLQTLLFQFYSAPRSFYPPIS